MNDTQRTEMMIRSSSKNLFVHNDADLTQPHVIAAIAAAASGMSLVADEEINANKNTVKEAIIQSYGAKENEAVLDLVDTMSPSDVKSAIAFSPDFMDYGHAYAVYKAQKDEYNKLFALTNQLDLGKKDTKTL